LIYETGLWHTRGDTFRRAFRLSDEWLGSQFSELKFTIRATLPTTDADESLLAQATKTAGDITFDADDGSLGYVVIPAETTTAWKPATYHWDLQATVDDSPVRVYTIARGKLRVKADVTRIP
jgi:hypothetical protein